MLRFSNKRDTHERTMIVLWARAAPGSCASLSPVAHLFRFIQPVCAEGCTTRSGYAARCRAEAPARRLKRLL